MRHVQRYELKKETIMRSGLFLPPFDALADPTVLASLAREAEEAGWDGFFLWDQIRWREPVEAVGDTQVALAAIASGTERIRFGPLVTPLARRRPAKVARETAALDVLSGGRLTLGVGLGSDHYAGEFSATGEEVDDRRRARMLDESLAILEAASSGEPVHHRGEHYTVDGVRFLPRPVQRPRVPIWVGGLAGNTRPLRRAVRYEGFFPVDVDHPERLAEIVAQLSVLRDQYARTDPTMEASRALHEPYDVIVELEPDIDPGPYAAAGATWCLLAWPWESISVDLLRGAIRDGPATPARRT
jgi:alkanesulfonate monooxygenase SsuD/methylene tetrahydromethanopterin reductase-like flavin-dependent oxidoreductase (luciferase family)